MSLIRKQTTEAMVAANRVNSLKCTGPVTDQGKMQVRLNALKHGIRAGKLVAEPGEREEDLQKLSSQLELSLRPSDPFEERLVSEMVENRRRRDRVVRAEAGLLRAQHLDFELEYARKLAGDGRSAASAGQAGAAAASGLAALPDSCAKFNLILQCLRGAQGAVEQEGFGEEGLARLEAVYGPNPGLAGAVLLTRYQEHQKEAAAGEAGPEEDAAKHAFLELLASEIACFEKLLELDEKADDELARARWESQDLLSDADSRRLTRYETSLDRQFDRQMKQLKDWREHKRKLREEQAAQEAAREELRGVPAPGSLGERLQQLEEEFPKVHRMILQVLVSEDFRDNLEDPDFRQRIADTLASEGLIEALNRAAEKNSPNALVGEAFIEALNRAANKSSSEGNGSKHQSIAR